MVLPFVSSIDDDLTGHRRRLKVRVDGCTHIEERHCLVLCVG